MIPTGDIAKNSYSCNRDMNDGIITATTTTESTTCNKKNYTDAIRTNIHSSNSYNKFFECFIRILPCIYLIVNWNEIMFCVYISFTSLTLQSPIPFTLEHEVQKSAYILGKLLLNPKKDVGVLINV